MFNEIRHQYSHFKNKELPWLISDHKFKYDENLEKNRDQLEKYNWIDRYFTYKFNSHGFRSEEFSCDDSIMFFGCSHTVGIGLPLEDTWAYQIAQSVNLKRFNLSIGATGPDTAFRLANHYIPQIKPKIVVYVEPPPGRFALVSADNNIYDFNFFNGIVYSPLSQFKNFYEHWISLEENLEIHSLKHKLAIQALCQQYNIKFVFAESDTEMEVLDYARDLSHSGIESNKYFAEIILNRINQNN